MQAEELHDEEKRVKLNGFECRGQPLVARLSWWKRLVKRFRQWLRTRRSIALGLSQISAFNGLFTKLGEIPLPM